MVLPLEKLFPVLYLFFLNPPGGVSGGSYLFYMPVAFKSMEIAFLPLVTELAARDHTVVVIHPYHLQHPIPGVTELVHSSHISALSSRLSRVALVDGSTSYDGLDFLKVALHANQAALVHPSVQTWVKTRRQFDVVVVCCSLFGDEAGYFLADKFNASLVLYHVKTMSNPWINWSTGNPWHPAYMSFFGLPYSPPLSLMQRTVNTVYGAVATIVRNYIALHKVNQLLAQVFPGEELGDLLEMERNAAIVMNAGNPFLGDGLRPVLPNTLLVGMMTCRPGKLLPENIQNWIDGAVHGVVYVSFGSVLKASIMPKDKRDLFIKVLGSLEQRVIWKWEEELPNAPPNILTSPWLPQQDILSHPNVKLFVSHGGAGSMQDTICHRTPVLGIPLSNDQLSNINTAVASGMAKVLAWPELSHQSLLEGVNHMLSNATYQEDVNTLADLVMDQPMHPLDTAVWWMEYLLRHPRNTRMKSPSLSLWWWQYFLLDVLLVVVVCVVAVLALLVAVLTLIKLSYSKIRRVNKKKSQ